MPLSPLGALVLALVLLLVLACVAAVLLNVPLLAIVVFATMGSVLIRAAYKQASKRRARQDTEA
jgi:hypothetical protein